MINRIVPITSPFLKYVRRSEALWMALPTRSFAVGRKDGTSGADAATNLPCRCLWSVRNTLLNNRVYLALNLRRESFDQPSLCPLCQHDNVARSVLRSKPSAVVLVES